LPLDGLGQQLPRGVDRLMAVGGTGRRDQRQVVKTPFAHDGAAPDDEGVAGLELLRPKMSRAPIQPAVATRFCQRLPGIAAGTVLAL